MPFGCSFYWIAYIENAKWNFVWAYNVNAGSPVYTVMGFYTDKAPGQHWNRSFNRSI